MAQNCPNGSSSRYDDFAAKNEDVAKADTQGNPLFITGTQAIDTGNISCASGCMTEADILFHDEPSNFRNSTQMGIVFANYGLTVDRSGKVCEVFQQPSGDYKVIFLKQLPNFPTSSNLISGNNLIKLQMHYAPGSSLTFNISYESNGQAQVIPLASNISSDSVNLSMCKHNNILKIFSQNVVNPSTYPTQFQTDCVAFGDGSIIGIGQLIITTI